MTDTTYTERSSDVLERARAAGFGITSRQLKRAHEEGLIPRPKQIWREGLGGSESAYPAGTSDQVIALCAIRRNHRSSNDVGWLLWFRGFAVAPKYWRGALAEGAAWLDTMTNELIRHYHTQVDMGIGGYLQKIKAARTRNIPFRRLRKRLGPELFEQFVGLMISVLDGSFADWQTELASDDSDLARDYTLIAKALGFNKSKHANKATSEQVTYDDLHNVFITISSRLSGPSCITDVLNACSNEQIIEARNDLRGLFSWFGDLLGRSTAAQGYGKSLGVLDKIIKHDPCRSHPLLLLYLLALIEDGAFQHNLSLLLTSWRASVLAMASTEQLDWSKRWDPAAVAFLAKYVDKTVC